MPIHVQDAPDAAHIDLGWAGCRIHADNRGLSLQAHADDEAGLHAITEFLRRHLEGAGPDVVWRRSGHRATQPDDAQRRDAMRHFHRAMRH